MVTNEDLEGNNKMNFRKRMSNSENALNTAVRTSHLSGYNRKTEA